MFALTSSHSTVRRVSLIAATVVAAVPVVAAATVAADNLLGLRFKYQRSPNFEWLPALPDANPRRVIVCFHGLWASCANYKPYQGYFQGYGRVLLTTNGTNVDHTAAGVLAELEKLAENEGCKISDLDIWGMCFSAGTYDTIMFDELLEQLDAHFVSTAVFMCPMRGHEYVIWPHNTPSWAPVVVRGGPLAEQVWRRAMKKRLDEAKAAHAAGGPLEAVLAAEDRLQFSVRTILSGARRLRRDHRLGPQAGGRMLKGRALIIYQTNDPRVRPGEWDDVAPHATLIVLPYDGHTSLRPLCEHYLRVITEFLARPTATEPTSQPA
jgi:hypothetical protein